MCVFFVFESGVNVSDEVIIVVIADDQLLKFTVLAHLTPHILVESVEVVLQLAGVHLILGVVGWVLVHVRHQDSLRVGRLDMFTGAAISVPTCADLVVERAIDLVLLCTENGSEIVGHSECVCRRNGTG